MMLTVDAVVSGYGDSEVLHEVSLSIAEREIVAILGPNGAGKTTLLKTVMGLVRATSGSIVFLENKITHKPTKDIMKLGVGYAPQGRSIVPHMTVRDNIEMGAYLYSDNKLIRERTGEMFAMFPPLLQRKDQEAGVLSGGERQMLVIARALMLAPKILLLDEPSVGLSPRFLSTLYQEIRRLNENGTAILLVEQNAKKALGIASRVYVMEAGRIRLEGTPKELESYEAIRDVYLGGAVELGDPGVAERRSP